MGVARVDKYVGIDVSKDTLDLAVRPTGDRYQQANDAEESPHDRGLVYLRCVATEAIRKWPGCGSPTGTGSKSPQ